jgi:hypothetical protein
VVAEVDRAAAERALPRQGQVQADPAGQGPGAAAHDGRNEEQLVFVDQACQIRAKSSATGAWPSSDMMAY